ncbi:acyl-CoA thioesterase [Alcaligenes sp. Marseille-Q7550]
MPETVRAEPGFVFDIPVRWGDLDAMNHVNNTVYFRYVEEARVQLMLKLGMLPPSTRTGVLAHASLDFVRPVLYPATVRVVHHLVRMGRSSLEVEVSVRDADQPEVVYARGRNVLVSISPEGRSQPWSEEEVVRIRQAFGA